MCLLSGCVTVLNVTCLPENTNSQVSVPTAGPETSLQGKGPLQLQRGGGGHGQGAAWWRTWLPFPALKVASGKGPPSPGLGIPKDCGWQASPAGRLRRCGRDCWSEGSPWTAWWAVRLRCSVPLGTDSLDLVIFRLLFSNLQNNSSSEILSAFIFPKTGYCFGGCFVGS